MMRLTCQNGQVFSKAEMSGLGVYLDTDSLIELATREPDRRDRFASAIKAGGNLLFSFTNAAEVAGLGGPTANAVKAFLSSVGPNWVPLEMDPLPVIERERENQSTLGPISLKFIEVFTEQRMAGPSLVDCSPEAFFDLGVIIDWSAKQPAIAKEKVRIDEMLSDRIRRARQTFERDPAKFQRQCPPVNYDPKKPATFVFWNLLRFLVHEFKNDHLKKHDGLDFCHAVLAASYGNLATLDKQWKRRIGSLPTPNGLARIFYRREVDQLVAVMEERLRPIGRQEGAIRASSGPEGS